MDRCKRQALHCLLVLILAIANCAVAKVKRAEKRELNAVELDFKLSDEAAVTDFLKEKWQIPTVHTIRSLPGERGLHNFELQDPNCIPKIITDLSESSSVVKVESFARFDEPNITLLIDFRDRSFMSRFKRFIENKTEQMVVDCAFKKGSPQ